jgi:hypothetical protein
LRQARKFVATTTKGRFEAGSGLACFGGRYKDAAVLQPTHRSHTAFKLEECGDEAEAL